MIIHKAYKEENIETEYMGISWTFDVQSEGQTKDTPASVVVVENWINDLIDDGSDFISHFLDDPDESLSDGLMDATIKAISAYRSHFGIAPTEIDVQFAGVVFRAESLEWMGWDDIDFVSARLVSEDQLDEVLPDSWLKRAIDNYLENR